MNRTALALLPTEMLLGLPIAGIRRNARSSEIVLRSGKRLVRLSIPSAALRGGLRKGSWVSVLTVQGETRVRALPSSLRELRQTLVKSRPNRG